MIYGNLAYSFLFALSAYMYYKIHKWWLTGRDENPIFFKPSTTVGTVKDWIIIIALIITSIIFFFKSI